MSAVATPPPAVDREARRRQVVRESGLEGIAFVEVLSNRAGTPGHVAGAPAQRTLLVHLLRGAVPAAIDAGRVAVLGGVRPDPHLNPVRVEWAQRADAVIAGPPAGVTAADRQLVAQALPEASGRDRVLVVRTSSSGDWSTYVLALRGPEGVGVPEGFDEPLASEPFNFTVDCPTDLDCRVEAACPPTAATSPLADYLARDYAALRTRLLDRLATLVPGWSDDNAADPLVTLAELFAFMGDRLTLWQDAAAAESYLSTARLRTSVRRHARLLDYRVHEGCAARTWLSFQVDAATTLKARTPAATAVPGLDPVKGVLEAIEAGATVFETVRATALRPARNALPLHAWGDDDACLPAGATAAYLRHPSGSDPELKAGDVLVLAPAIELAPGGTAAFGYGGAEARRRAVRLVADPLVHDDELAGGETVLEIHWGSEDALEVPLPLTERDGDGIRTIAAAFANVALAEHAGTLEGLKLEPPQVPLEDRYRPRLPVAGLAWVDETVDETGAAAAALRPDPRRARAQATLDDGASTWTARPDLLGSGRLDADFVAEREAGGLVRLRFGDGASGRRPTAGTVPEALLRVGGGSEGNLAAETLGVGLGDATGIALTNPLPARGGAAPEVLEAVRELAPYAFRTQLRAVTSADYADAATEVAGVQRAVARRRWAGSWYAQEVTLDLLAEDGGEAVDAAVAALLDTRRLAGVDVELAPPVAVPLEIVLGVCVGDGYARADVARQLTQALSVGVRPDGSRGFFHPDNFTFGQSLFLSDLVEAVMAVPGVAWVDVDDSAASGLRFRRFGRPPAGEVGRGRIDAGPREVLRADSDPSNPENGRVELRMRGGA